MWRMGSSPTDADIFRAKKSAEVQRAREKLNDLNKALSFLPDTLMVFVYRSYVLFEEWKINSQPAYTAPAGLIAGMAVVFALFNVRSLNPFMRKWFMHRPVVFSGGEWRNCLTMFTSTVSKPLL